MSYVIIVPILILVVIETRYVFKIAENEREVIMFVLPFVYMCAIYIGANCGHIGNKYINHVMMKCNDIMLVFVNHGIK